MPTTKLVEILLEWYHLNKRELPWREYSDPYTIWVSEVMLQQTRVETVIPYFQKWLIRFPTLEDLAQATLNEVLSIWEGLGYYQRAHNLHKGAQYILSQYGGELPKDVEELQRVPGIGKYTAGAIASIAFNFDVTILEGNIRRVFSRLFLIEYPIGTKTSEKLLQEIISDNLPFGRCRDYNQALMDFGSIICIPGKPKCGICPVVAFCKANKYNLQNSLPIIKKHSKIHHFEFANAVILDKGKVVIVQRPLIGLLGGLWEFPSSKRLNRNDLEEGLRNQIHNMFDKYISIQKSLGIYKHAYTHFRVTHYVFICHFYNEVSPLKVDKHNGFWVYIENLHEFPMGKIDRMISEDLAKGYLC